VSVKGDSPFFLNGEEMNSREERIRFDLGEYRARVDERLDKWTEEKFIQRLWDKDHTLWSSEPVPELTDRLGWLVLPEVGSEILDSLAAFAQEVRKDSITHVVLLGMGGSSLAPEVFTKCFGNSPEYPELTVLDSSHPAAVQMVEERLSLSHTLFIVSSKSGTTLETLSLFRHFWKKLCQVDTHPGKNFVAITDPGSPLEQLAKERGFRVIFLAPPDVGGRYSALTVFGLVPAALIGVDVHRLIERSRSAAETCRFPRSKKNAEALILGAILGELSSGRNKITLMTDPSLSSFSDWAEQLIAESTGKAGKGIIPVVNEPMEPAEYYSDDRLFIGLFLEDKESNKIEEFFSELSVLGHPVIRIHLEDIYDLGQEFFLWEIAVASAGAVMGINPFNQPDVQLAKDFTKKIMEGEKISEKGKESAKTLDVSDHDFLATALEDWTSQAQPGDYIALQAFLPPTSAIADALQILRKKILDRMHLATTLGYGPRFLHSTGQLHKGGPNNGLFLQLVDDPRNDLVVPEPDLTFSQIVRAQAIGDYHALIERQRRVLRVDLQKDVITGLESLQRLFIR
jgi:transaldolase/glucose-6-phosphate isomerase